MKSWITRKEIVITSITFLFIFGLSFIPFDCKYLNPLANTLSDFDIFDIVSSQLMEEQPPDTNIVLVNAGEFNRSELAELITYLNTFNPRVIGIDILFESRIDSSADSALQAALNQNNIVLISKLDNYNEKSKSYDSLIFPKPEFYKGNHNGYANLPEDKNGSRTIRDFRPFVYYRNKPVPAFSSAVVSLYDKPAYKLLFERGRDLEKINYRGNYKNFYFLDTDTFDDSLVNLSFIKNKIVLLGYMGPNINTKTFEDIFFTPLNPIYTGRSFPDMYGIVIHANIISMLINKSYLHAMPAWLSFILSVLICWLNIKLLLRIKKMERKAWFGLLTKLSLFAVTTLNLFFSLIIFYYFNYRINLTLALLAVVLSLTSIDFYESYISSLIEGKKDIQEIKHKIIQKTKLKKKHYGNI